MRQLPPSHSKYFFKEKELKIRRQIDSMKSELGISYIDDTKLEASDYCKALQASSQGIHLLNLLDEYKKIQEHSKIIEEECFSKHLYFAPTKIKND